MDNDICSTADLISDIIIGIMIVVFLILEPHGLARLWAIIKQKLRVWPFPVLGLGYLQGLELVLIFANRFLYCKAGSA